MKMEYPSRKSPLVPKPLLSVLEKIIIPEEICQKHGIKFNSNILDIAQIQLLDLSADAIEDLGRFVAACVGEKNSELKKINGMISSISLKAKFVMSKINIRNKNSLMRSGFKDSDDFSQIPLSSLFKVKNLGPLGILEIFSVLYLFTDKNSYDNKNNDLVFSKALSNLALELSKKDWATNVYINDPRIADDLELLDMGFENLTLAEVAKKIESSAHQVETVQSKKYLLRSFILKNEQRLNFNLKQEVVEIIEFIETNFKYRQIVTARLGLDGEDPITLEEVGQKMGITRERVRQIEAKTIKKIKNYLPIWTPVLDKAIKIISKYSLIHENKLQMVLLKEKVVAERFSIKSIQKIAEVFSRNIRIEFDAETKLVGSNELIQYVPKILGVIIRLIDHWGALNIDNVVLKLEQDGIKVNSQHLVEILEINKDICWLDDDKKWFWIKTRNSRNRVLNSIEKIMSVAGEINLGDLRNGTGRSNRMHGVRLPSKILLSLCLSSGKYIELEGKRIGGINLPDWGETLTGVEKTLVEILFRNGFVMKREKLEEAAISSGINKSTFYVYLGYSPVIQRYAHGVYGLRGASINAAKVKSLIPQLIRKGKSIQDYGFTDSGNPWIGFKMSRSSTASGVLGSPSSFSRYIIGSYKLITETKEVVGTLVVKSNNMWGLSPFFRTWGVESGDYIVLEFKKSNDTVLVTAGDQELLGCYQNKEEFQFVEQVLI